MNPKIHQALQALLRHRLRSGLCILGIACGVISFLILMGAGEGAKRQTVSQLERLGVRNIVIRSPSLSEAQLALARRQGSAGLTLQDGNGLLAAVREAHDFAALRELRATARFFGKAHTPPVLEASASFFSLMDLKVDHGRSFSEEDSRNQSLVAILGGKLSEDLGTEGMLGSELRIGPALYKVVGILRRSEKRDEAAIASRDLDSAVILPLNTSRADEGISELLLSMHTRSSVLEALPLIRRSLEVFHHGAEDYELVVPQELIRQTSRTLGTFDTLLISIALISLGVGGIGIMNMMLANISERIHEIGIRRAVGASARAILYQFLLEATLLAGLGGLLGVAVGLFASWLSGAWLKMPIALTPSTVLLPFVLAIAMGVAFGLVPALKASRMDPIEALR